MVNIFSKSQTAKIKSFIVIILTLSIGFVIHAKPLIAITAIDKNTAKLADLAMVKLSEKNILFVERIKINKILKEQKLSAGRLVNASSLIRTGVILGADIIVVLSKKRLIAFDVKTGIRLQDRLFNNANFETKLNRIISSVLNSIKKHQSIKTQNTILFSFLPINIISLNEKESNSAKTVELLLKQKLLKQKNYLVLERDLVDSLVNEKIISGSILKDLLLGSYIAELEARKDSARGKYLTITLALKKSGFKKLKAIKVLYPIRNEKRAITGILKKLDRILKTPQAVSSPTRKAEALTYLKDSRDAFKHFDPTKSILSAKNAYLLDSSLKKQVNELLIKNYYYLLTQIKKMQNKGLKKKTNNYKKVTFYAQTILKIGLFYKSINGEYLEYRRFYFECINILPKKLQNEIRQIYQQYFIEEFAKIKRKYDYKAKAPGTFEYFETYKSYIKNLGKLVHINWTCEYWLKYMEPEAANYLNEVEEFYRKNPPVQNLPKKYVSELDSYYRNNPQDKKLHDIIVSATTCSRGWRFYTKDREFDLLAFNKAYDIWQRMLKSSIIEWKMAAIGLLYHSRDRAVDYVRFARVYSPYYANYREGLIKRINMPSKFTKIKTQDKIIFLNSCLDVAHKSSYQTRKLICEYFEMNIHHYLIDKKKNFDTTLYIKAVKAKLPMKKFMFAFSYEQLLQLQKATKEIDNPSFKQLLKKYIGFKTRKNIPDSKTDDYLLSREKFYEIKEFSRKYGNGNTAKMFFYPSTTLIEKNIIYIPLYDSSFTYFALVKVILADKIKVTQSKLKKDTANLSGFSHERVTYMGYQNLFVVFANGAIAIYPKSGAPPKLAQVKGLSGTQIQSVCFFKGKLYLFVKKSYGKNIPTKIIEFNPYSKTSRVIFSEKQTVNNPFRNLPLNMKSRGIMYPDKKKSRLVIATKDDYWYFYPKTRKWKKKGPIKLYAGTPKYKFKKIKKTFLACSGNSILKLIDIGKKRYYINKFAKALNLKPEKYKQYSSLQLKLKQGNKFVPITKYHTVLCGTNLYRERSIIFLKQKKIVKFSKETVLLPFEYKQKQYYISSKYTSNTVNNLELWINTVNKNPTNANDFDKIIVSVPTKSNFAPSTATPEESRKTLSHSKYKSSYYDKEYISIIAPSELPKDFYYPKEAFVEKNIMLVPNYSRSFKYFYLLKIDLANGLKTTFGKIGELKISLAGNHSLNETTCIGRNNFFMISSRGVIIYFPKNGNSPKFIRIKELDKKSISRACFLNGKVYIFFRKEQRGGKTPCKIAEFDPGKKVLKYIFVNDKKQSNPFRGFKDFTLRSNVFADETNKCIILFEANSGFWRFFPVTGKWGKIEFKNHELKDSLFNARIVNNTFFTLGEKQSMELLDFSSSRKDINSFSQATGLKVNAYDNYSAIKFQLKRGGKMQYIGSLIFNNNNLFSTWGGVKFLKSLNNINPRESLLATFSWKDKQYFLFVKYNKSQEFNYSFDIYTIKPNATHGGSFKIVNAAPSIRK